MSNSISLPGRANARAALGSRHGRSVRLGADFGSGTLLSKVFASLRVWALVLDEDFAVLKANTEAARGLGGGSKALARRDARRLLGELDPADVFERFAGEADPEETRGFVARPEGSGGLRNFRLQALHDRYGHRGYLVTGGEELALSGCEEDVETAVMDAPRRTLSGRSDPAVIVETSRWTVLEGNERYAAWAGVPRGSLKGASLAPRFPDAESFSAFRREAVGQTLRSGCGTIAAPLDDGHGALAPFRVNLIAFRVPGELRDRLTMVFEDASAEAARDERIGRLVDDLERAAGALVGTFRSSAHARTEDRRLSSLGASQRQVAIARLLLEGATTKEAAVALELSESTVNSHLSMLYRKLGTFDRAGFMRKVAERRLLPE
ncbi:MAG: helix-turn-helix transcriptional regulator [Spirochaetales bacterium]|nr:helix-turn-helix transcriptional regulator [Spirochaetales bacterium]